MPFGYLTAIGAVITNSARRLLRKHNNSSLTAIPNASDSLLTLAGIGFHAAFAPGLPRQTAVINKAAPVFHSCPGPLMC